MGWTCQVERENKMHLTPCNLRRATRTSETIRSEEAGYCDESNFDVIQPDCTEIGCPSCTQCCEE